MIAKMKIKEFSKNTALPDSLDFNDEFNLVEAVRSLWQSPELREEFIENGKKTVKKFSSEKMVEETIKSLNP